MTDDDPVTAISAAAGEMRRTLEVESDPGKRLQALLLCYGRYAQIHAASFVKALAASSGSKPHRNAEDLDEHARVVADELKAMLLSNIPAELDFSEFRLGTEQLVDRVFFQHFHALIAEQPVMGSA